MQKLLIALTMALVFGFSQLATAGSSCVVDMETVTVKNLTKLKGVGDKLAKKIIEYRKTERTKATKAKRKKWQFRNWKTMMLVKGVAKQICVDNLDKVCFGGKPQKRCPK